MNKDTFIEELRKLNIEVKDDYLNKLDIYMNYLIEYNSHTNLTAIKEPEEIYLKHFYDSLTIVKSVDLSRYNSLVDIGSGAGFPGMVLKIFFPHLNITLIDSNNKKTKFLIELSKKLSLNVDVVNDRVENFSKNNLNKFDIVTSRAVANLRVLAELAIPLVKVDGLFVALKGNMDDSLEDSISTIEILDSKIINRITFNLYNNSGLRNIIVIKKEKSTDVKLLRPYDKIIKKPLKKNSK
ncbi:MAG: 16S rRNA (guanine(527)-N(7))-methyltransferase RsmG [Bacilli bacterium]|nr:16S rRNA (guanine(527)-N(7))-methyltransferase RsmG [Bacilli bacterium]